MSTRMIEQSNGGKAEKGVSAEPTRAWTVQQVALASLITVGIAFVFLLLYQFYTVLFLAFAAIILAVAIQPAIEWLQRRGIRKHFGVLLIYTALLATVTGFAWLIGPLLVEQVSALVTELPTYYSQLRLSLAESGNPLLGQVAIALPQVPALPSPPATEETSALGTLASVWRFVRSVSYLIFVVGAVVALSYCWTLEGDIIMRRALLLLPGTARDEARTLQNEMGATIGNYFRGQVILCVIVGVLSLIGYLSIGLPYALGLAAVMALFEAVPLIGPLLGAIPAVLVAFAVAPDRVIWVVGVVAVIQVSENYLLVPRVMSHSVGINAMVSTLSIASFGALFGLPGAILAIPLAAMLQIVLNRLVFQRTSEAEPRIATPTSGTERNVVSKMRLQTQKLILDVRKGTRSDSEKVEPAIENVEDRLEAIALDLDSLLGRAEPDA